MELRLHKNATTTPARRAQIQASSKPVREIGREFGISKDTVRRWRARDSVTDRSRTRHRLHAKLSEAPRRLSSNSGAHGICPLTIWLLLRVSSRSGGLALGE